MQLYTIRQLQEMNAQQGERKSKNTEIDKILKLERLHDMDQCKSVKPTCINISPVCKTSKQTRRADKAG